MTVAVAELAFVVACGLAIGSFLNVCIYRVPRRESIASPASRCTSCGYTLRWYDNVPLLSYALLGGRCRSCKARVSLVYPLVELATAIAIALEFTRWGWTPAFAVHAAFACVMIVLFVTDLEHRLLPNAITIPGTIVGFAVTAALGGGWLDALLGIAVGGGTLFGISEAYFRVRGEEGMGMGDVKMMALVGAWLGWRLTLLTLILGSLIGSVIGVVFIVARGRDMKYALPFGTFLAIAAVIADSAGAAIIAWYMGFYA